MKKLLFALFFLCMHYCVCAQHGNSQPDPVGLMENYLIEKKELDEGHFDMGLFLGIENMLSNTYMYNNRSGLNNFIRKEDIGLFSFSGPIWYPVYYLLLKSGNDYKIQSLYIIGENEDEFLCVLSNIIDYLQRHPEIDDRLYPYYISGMSEEYLVNTRGFAGDWEDWHLGPWGVQSRAEKYKYGIDVDDK